MSDRLRVCSTGLQLDAPFESVVTYRIRYLSVITGLPAALGKYGKYKFRAIADASTAEIGETDKWVIWK